MQIEEIRKNISSMADKLRIASKGGVAIDVISETILLLFVLDTMVQRQTGLLAHPKSYLAIYKGIQELGQHICFPGKAIKDILSCGIEDDNVQKELSRSIVFLDRLSEQEVSGSCLPEFSAIRECNPRELYAVVGELTSSLRWIPERTSSSISEIASVLLNVDENHSFCDFFCGNGFSSSVILKNGCRKAILNDVNPHNIAIARCMTVMCGIQNSEFYIKDGLTLDHVNLDRIFIDAPLKVKLREHYAEGINDLCSAGILKAVSMLSDGGLVAVTVPSSFLYVLSGAERRVRDWLVSERFLKGVIAFPGNMIANSPVNTAILLISKKKNDSIYMVDFSSETAEKYSYYNRSEHVRFINEEGLHIIVEATKKSFKKYISFELEYSKIEPEENILLPSRYSEKAKIRTRSLKEIDSDISECVDCLNSIFLKLS